MEGNGGHKRVNAVSVVLAEIACRLPVRDSKAVERTIPIQA